MRIMLVIDNLGSGGMQAQIVNLVNGLLERGHYISLVLYFAENESEFFNSRLALSNNNIIRLGCSDGFSFKVIKYIHREAVHYDVIFSFLHTSNFYVSCAKFLNLFTQRKPVFRCISVDMSSFENRRVVKQRMLSVISSFFSNLMISNSRAQTNYYLKMPWGKQKSIFIPNGVDDTAFLNEAHFLADEGRDYLLVVGRISAAKNGPSFVNAVATLTRNRDRKIKVVWVGRLDNDEAARADRALMDEAIGKLESQDRLDWTWAGEVDDVRPFYRGAACLVIPSRWEGVPNVLIEAMLSGCPVVATPVSDLASILVPTNAGVLCNGVEGEDIAAGITLFEQLPAEEVHDMCQRAQFLALSDFSISKMIDRYEAAAAGLEF